MLEPIQLFGKEQRDNKCLFIHDEGRGYWFVSYGHKTVGDIQALSKINTELELRELNINYLILGIINDKKELLLAEYCTKNPNNLKQGELNSLLENDRELLIHLESYVRQQFGEGNLIHPAIYPYKEQLGGLLTSSLNAEYRLACVECAFNFRVVTDPSVIKQDSEDPEKGTIYCKTLTSTNVVGASVNLSKLSEALVNKIGAFIENEFNKRPTLTTKEQQIFLDKAKAEIEESTQTIEEDENTEIEKKPSRTKSQTLKTE
jgi:hypothetical protein